MNSTTISRALRQLYRLYKVERATGERSLWSPAGYVRIRGGDKVTQEAKRLASVYGCRVRLILDHPTPPVEIVCVMEPPSDAIKERE